MALDYSKVRFLWRGDAGRKVSSGRYEKIYDMGPRAATGDATFATAATRPIVDELSDWYGLAVDPTATNHVRNNTMVGAVVGTPGTLPTNWTELTNGLTRQVVAVGTQDGVEYIDLRFSGTATSSGLVEIRVDGTAAPIVASVGQTWTNSAWMQVIAQPTPAVDYRIMVYELTSGGGFISTNSSVQSSVNLGVFSRKSYTVTLSQATVGLARPAFGGTVTSGQSYDFTIRIGLPQMELGSFPTQVKKTSGSTVTFNAVVAPITDAIPVTGTIIMWDNMVNAYASGPLAHRIFDSEETGSARVRLRKNEVEVSQLDVEVHNATGNTVRTANLEWQPSNQRKRWFFAMTYNGTTVQLYRGDVQGNISKVLDTSYTPVSAIVRDMYLHTTASGTAQVGASYLDILTYDDVLTQSEIEAIFYGEIPIFQQTAYAGTFVDKFRQKVQAEPASTYVTTLESTVLADWSEDIFGAYDADASAFFSRGFDDGATIENIDFANTQILALKALA